MASSSVYQLPDTFGCQGKGVVKTLEVKKCKNKDNKGIRRVKNVVGRKTARGEPRKRSGGEKVEDLRRYLECFVNAQTCCAKRRHKPGWIIQLLAVWSPLGQPNRSPWTLEHHLTVNAHWDKQEVLKKRPRHLTHTNPPPSLTASHSTPSPDRDQYTAGASAVTVTQGGRKVSMRRPPEEAACFIYNRTHEHAVQLYREGHAMTREACCGDCQTITPLLVL